MNKSATLVRQERTRGNQESRVSQASQVLSLEMRMRAESEVDSF